MVEWWLNQCFENHLCFCHQGNVLQIRLLAQEHFIKALKCCIGQQSVCSDMWPPVCVTVLLTLFHEHDIFLSLHLLYIAHSYYPQPPHVHTVPPVCVSCQVSHNIAFNSFSSVWISLICWTQWFINDAAGNTLNCISVPFYVFCSHECKVRLLKYLEEISCNSTGR